MKPITLSSGNLFTTVTNIGKIILLVIIAVFCFLNDVSAGIKPYKASSVATLNSLSFNPVITRTTVPGPDFKDYTATVPGYVSSIKVIPVTTDPASTIKVNGVTAISGAESSAISLNVGNNAIATVVTASDGVTTNTYRITVIRQTPPIVTLSSLGFSPVITTTTVPGPDFKDYTATVPNSVSSVIVTPKATDPAATIKVNGKTVASGTKSAAIPLNSGNNTIITIVKGSDGVTTKTYSITINRLVSTVATLNSLRYNPTIESVAASGPDFGNYTATVGNSVSSVKAIPVTTDATATVKINGVTVVSGAASASIPLNIGSNTITAVVTAADGITKLTYKIVIARQGNAILTALTFSIGRLTSITKVAVPGPYYRNYRGTIEYYYNSVVVEPLTEDPSSTVKVNGVTVATGAKSGTIALNFGDNTITTVVTAADGVTVNTYNIIITRLTEPIISFKSLSTYPAATFTNLATATVATSVSSVKVIPVATDLQANVKINGVTITPGDSSASIALKVGKNPISVKITSSDGRAINSFTLTITRSAPTPPTLSSFTFNPSLSLIKIGGADFADYAASAADTLNSIKVTPATADPASTVTVNGVVVISGHSSAAIPIAYGPNVVSIKVTASDHFTSSTYKITVTKPHVLTLVADPTVELPNHGGFLPLTQVSGPHTKDYTLTIPYSVQILTISATAKDPTAIVNKGIGHPNSNTSVFTQQYQIGVSRIDVTVQSADNSHYADYFIAITRAGPPNDVNLNSQQWNPSIYLSAATDANGSYSAGTVSNSVNRAYVDVVPQDPFATASINGIALISNRSDYFPLIVGNNTFLITITSANGLAHKIYRTVLTRLPPTPNALAYNEDSVLPLSNRDVVVHQSVSPNGDGIGDYLLIDGIAAYPDNKLTIINAGGALVYEATGYDNTLKVFKGGSSITDKLQRPGTYFYSLDYKQGNNLKHKTGYLILKY
jgi:hypothetical protein